MSLLRVILSALGLRRGKVIRYPQPVPLFCAVACMWFISDAGSCIFTEQTGGDGHPS